MPTAAYENRVLDALSAALVGIGTPPASWLTQPVYTEGIPSDPVPAVANRPRLYLQHVRTEPAEDPGTSRHRWRASFKVWLFGDSMRTVISLKADVLRAVFAIEASLTQTFGQPAWVDSFTHRDDMCNAGSYAGELTLFLDFDTDHAAP